MHETGCSGLVHCNDPEGWDGEQGGRRVQDGETHVHPWLIHVNVWQKPPQYCKVISLELKQIIILLKSVFLAFQSYAHVSCVHETKAV